MRFLGIVVGTLSVGEVNNGSVSISYGIGRIVLRGLLVSDGMLAVTEQHGQAALEVLGNRLVRELAVRGRRNQADELRATTLPFLTVSNALG